MGNLTQEYGAIKPNVPPAPIEGYRVVVFEKKQRGVQFKAILNSGDQPIKEKSWSFTSSPDYKCWAVNTHPDLNFHFDIQMTLANQYQDFTLNCMVYYHISSPRIIAQTFEDDPLQKIQERIAYELKLNVLASTITIQDIREHFFILKDKILPYTTLNQLRDFAGEYGIVIKEINMTYKIPERFLAPDRKIEEYELEKKTAVIEEDKKRIHQRAEIDEILHGGKKKELVNVQDAENTQHQEQMENLKRFHQFQREIADLLREGLGKIIDPIDNPEGFKKAFDVALSALKRVVSEIQSPGFPSSKKQISGFSQYEESPMLQQSSSVENASQYLSAIESLIESSSIPKDEKKLVLSSLYHLKAESQMDERADQNLIKKNIDKLCKYINTYSTILPHQIVEYMRKFKEINERFINPEVNCSDVSDNPDELESGE